MYLHPMSHLYYMEMKAGVCSWLSSIFGGDFYLLYVSFLEQSNPVCAELWSQADASTSTDVTSDNRVHSVLGDNDVLTSHKV